jgi:hypothetical protein
MQRPLVSCTGDFGPRSIGHLFGEEKIRRGADSIEVSVKVVSPYLGSLPQGASHELLQDAFMELRFLGALFRIMVLALVRRASGTTR